MASSDRVLTRPRGQGAIDRVAKADERLRIVPLAGAARIGVRVLQDQRLAVVLDLRALSVSQIAIIGIEPVSAVPTSDQPTGDRMRLILMPTTDWLMPLGVCSHWECGPLCLVTMLETPLFHAAL